MAYLPGFFAKHELKEIELFFPAYIDYLFMGGDEEKCRNGNKVKHELCFGPDSNLQKFIQHVGAWRANSWANDGWGPGKSENLLGCMAREFEENCENQKLSAMFVEAFNKFEEKLKALGLSEKEGFSFPKEMIEIKDRSDFISKRTYKPYDSIEGYTIDEYEKLVRFDLFDKSIHGLYINDLIKDSEFLNYKDESWMESIKLAEQTISTDGSNFGRKITPKEGLARHEVYRDIKDAFERNSNHPALVDLVIKAKKSPEYKALEESYRAQELIEKMKDPGCNYSMYCNYKELHYTSELANKIAQRLTEGDEVSCSAKLKLQDLSELLCDRAEFSKIRKKAFVGEVGSMDPYLYRYLKSDIKDNFEFQAYCIISGPCTKEEMERAIDTGLLPVDKFEWSFELEEKYKLVAKDVEKLYAPPEGSSLGLS